MKKDSKTILNFCVNDLLRKLFVLFVVLYLSFFAVETILPGIVADIININIFLVLIFVVLIMLDVFSNAQEGVRTIKIIESCKSPLVALLLVFLAFVFVVALYKISLLESLVYLALSLIVGKLFFSFLKK